MTLWPFVMATPNGASRAGSVVGPTPAQPGGIEQATRLRARLRHRQFEATWSSDLARASEFARLSFRRGPM